MGESVDYAVMENTAHAAMVPADMAWSDIGNWDALHRRARARWRWQFGARAGPNWSIAAMCWSRATGPRVSVIGLEGVIVVVDGDEVLVTSVDGAQKVGKLSGAANQ